MLVARQLRLRTVFVVALASACIASGMSGCGESRTARPQTAEPSPQGTAAIATEPVAAPVVNSVSPRSQVDYLSDDYPPAPREPPAFVQSPPPGVAGISLPDHGDLVIAPDAVPTVTLHRSGSRQASPELYPGPTTGARFR